MHEMNQVDNIVFLDKTPLCNDISIVILLSHRSHKPGQFM